MDVKGHDRINVCICYPSSTTLDEMLVQDICDEFTHNGFHAWSFDINSSAHVDLQPLIDADWVLTLLTSDQRDSIAKNPAIDDVLRQKIINESVLTLRLADAKHIDAPIILAHIQWADLTDFMQQYPTDRSDEAQLSAWQYWLAEKCSGVVARINAGSSYEDTMQFLDERLQPDKYVKHVVQHTSHFVGRNWLMDEIKDWWLGGSEERICLLEGPFGIGKSAFSANLAETNGNVIGVYFCDSDEGSEQGLSLFVRTLIFQVAARVRDYRNWLITQLKEQDKFSHDNLIQMNAVQLARELMFNGFGPSLDMAADVREQLLIIVEGLDRTFAGNDSDVGNTWPDFIVRELGKNLPKSVRLLVTSRMHSAISGAFAGNVIKLHKDDVKNAADIKAFLEDALKAEGLSDGELTQALAASCKASEGSMLYASVLMRAVKSGDVTLPLQNTPELKELSGIYLSTMSDMCGIEQWYAQKQGAAPCDVARVIANRDKPVSLKELSEALEVKRTAANRALKPLNGLLFVDTNDHDEKIVTFFHSSFGRWLTAPRQPHDYQL